MPQIKTFNFNVQYKPFGEKSKMQLLTGKDNWKRLNINVTDGKSMQVLQLFSSKPKNGEISVQLKNEEEKYVYTKINYEDRFNSEIVDNVNSYKKYVIDLGERKEFVHELDFLEEVYEAIIDGKFDNKNLFIRGELSQKIYKEKTQTTFIPMYIGYSKSEELTMYGEMSFIFDKYSLDDSMFDKESKFIVNGYVENYSSEHKKNLMIPNEFTFDFSMVKELEDETAIEKRMRAVEFMRNIFKVKKGYYEMGFKVSFLAGKEEVPFDEKDLSKFIKDQIEFGLTTLEQVKKEIGVVGEYKRQVRLGSPLVKQYTEGVIKRDELDEEDFIIRDVVEEKTMAEVKKEEPKKIVKEEPAKTESIDDLLDGFLG